MVPPLRDSDRRALMYIALLAVCGTLLLLPLAGESSSSMVDADATSKAMPLAGSAELEGLHFPDIPVVRDPFVPDLAEAGVPAHDVSPDEEKIGMALPPNEGASNMPLPSASEGAAVPIVRAVILGTQSKALVDIAGQVRILGIGDKIGVSTVTAVDANGLSLNNGSRLVLLERDI